MKKFGKLVPCLAALTLSLAAACDSAEPSDDVVLTPVVATRPAAKDLALTGSSGKPAKKDSGKLQLPTLPTTVDLPAVTERSSLLQRLPKATLFALRLPHVEQLGTAMDRAGLRELLNTPESQRTLQSLQQLFAEFTHEFGGEDQHSALIASLTGEAVYAVVSESQSSGKKSASTTGIPFTQALMFDAGPRADEVESLLQRLLARLKARADLDPTSVSVAAIPSTTAGNWRARIHTPVIDGDLMREGTQFLLWLTPANGALAGEHPLATHEIEVSFLASDIVRGTKDLSRDGSAVVVEAFVNLAAIWKTLEGSAGADIQPLLAVLDAGSIRGVSAVAALSNSGIDEQVLWLSPGGKDLLTRAVTNRALEMAIARYLPPGASYATMGSFDVGTLFDGVTQLLSDTDKSDMQKSLGDLKREGFDLRGDLIDNVGPTFAFTGHFDVTRMNRSDETLDRGIDFTVIAEVREVSRLRGMVDAFVARNRGRMEARAKDIHGFMAYGLDPIALPATAAHPALFVEPHWYFGDGVFIFSLSRTGLARSLSASWKEANRGPEELRVALEREGTGAFAIGVGPNTKQTGAAATVGRRTGLGLEISSRGGPGSATAYALAAGFSGVVSAAIPRLLDARLAANEDIAVATLRTIAKAEIEFRARALVDLDGDSEGEFGTLMELAGLADLRGGKPALTPPLLDDSFKPDENGVFERSGYMFRLELSRRLTRRIDFDEREFSLLAWPIGADTTGRRAFSIDAELTILATDNRAPDQSYSGTARMPKPDAPKRTKAAKTRSLTAIPLSSDGGVWSELD